MITHALPVGLTQDRLNAHAFGSSKYYASWSPVDTDGKVERRRSRAAGGSSLPGRRHNRCFAAAAQAPESQVADGALPPHPSGSIAPHQGRGPGRQ
jgi:hypothetical protein